MPLTDDLEKQVGPFLAKAKVTNLVNNKQLRRLIVLEFFQEGVVSIGCDQMIDHIHGGGKKDLDAGLGGCIGHGLG